MLDAWDVSILLDVPFAVSVPRVAFRDGTEPDPAHPSVTRYVQGNKRYFAPCAPWYRATVVVDNSDLAHPRITALR